MNTRIVPALLLLCSLVGDACATAPPRLPSRGLDVTGIPRFDDFVAQSFEDTQAACRPRIVTARALVRGRVGRRHIDASFWVGVDETSETSSRPGLTTVSYRVRLESMETGPSRFAVLATYSFGSKNDDATLLLSDGRWVARSRSREMIEFVLGVPLSILDFRSVLTGCPAITGDFKFERFDDATMKLVTESGNSALEMFMRRDRGLSPWSVFAIVGSVPGRPVRWRADLGQPSRGVLESVRLTSLEWDGNAGRQFDLMVSFDRIQTPAVGTDLLSLPVPESAEPIAIDTARSNLSVPLLAD